MEFDLINDKLNEDCFINIFSFLNIIDIINATLVCKNFRKMAIATFPSKFNKVNLNGPPFSMTLMQVNILFTTFGNFIRKLKVNAIMFELNHEHISRTALILIERHCLPNLYELSLTQFYYPEISEKILTKFDSLSKLQLSMVTMNITTPKIAYHNNNLETLVIHNCTNTKFFNELPENHVTNLNLKKFITRGNLQMFSVHILENIHMIMPNLQEFEFNDRIIYKLQTDVFNEFLPNVGFLRNLSKLVINCQTKSVVPLLEKLIENKINLTHLTIIETSLNTYSVEKISELLSLEYLMLSEVNGLLPTHVIHLISTLSRLEELVLHLLNLELSPFIPQYLGPSIHKLKKLGLYHVYGRQISINEYKHIFSSLETKLTIELSNGRIATHTFKFACPNKIHELTIIKNNNHYDRLIEKRYDIDQ